MLKFFSTVPDTAQADSCFAEAYACLEQGLYYDEANDYNNTIEMYERGLNLIIEGEKMKNSKKAELYKDMMEAKLSVQYRIKVMKNEGLKTLPSENADSLKAKVKDDDEGAETTAPTYPTSLQVLQFSRNAKAEAHVEEQPSAFIQVGPWVYPLLKEQTPILRNEFGGYVVHNPTPEHPHMMVAILLPSDVEPRIHEEFQQILQEHAVLKEQDTTKELTPEENSRLGKKIAEFLIIGGEKVAWGVQTVTVRVSSKIDAEGERYRSTMSPTEAPWNINPAIRGSVLYMYKGSKVVAKCTRFLLDKIGDMGISVGKMVASGAHKTFGNGKTGGLVSGTITVIGGGIVGASSVWMSLEEGSKTLARSIANQTVQHVKIKYGEDASQTTHHALHAAGHSGLAAVQLWDLGPRSIAGRVAKKAGIQMISDLHRSSSGPLPIKSKVLQ